MVDPKKILKSVQRNREVKGKSKRQLVGKTTKLPVYQWMLHIFEMNEKLTATQKLSDGVIVASIKAEFSPRLALVRSLIQTPSKLSSERARFNKDHKWAFLSLKYNENGIPITGSRAMSLSEIRKKCFYYKKLDPRFFSEEELLWFDQQISEGNPYYSDCITSSQEECSKFPFGSVTLGVPDHDPISIEILELEWMKND